MRCHPSGAGAKLSICELVFDAIHMSDPVETGAPLQLITAPTIEKRILVVRERQAMLDEDLADLYGVETRALVQQVKRNAKRFPADFMFQLSAQEFNDLKSQSVMASGQHGGRRTRPLVFTEQGVAMLSGVLRSERAVAVNIETCELSSSFAVLRPPTRRSRSGSRSSSERPVQGWASMTSSWARSSGLFGN